jgi:serine/threonine-protein kinase
VEAEAIGPGAVAPGGGDSGGRGAIGAGQAARSTAIAARSEARAIGVRLWISGVFGYLDYVADWEPLALPPGGTFNDRYRIIRRIGGGGMGTVFEVVDTVTRRRRALKVMLPSVVGDPDLRERFALEALVAADVDSEHIVDTLDAGVDPASKAPFLVMELLKGEDLRAVLATRGRLPAPEVVLLLGQVAHALDRMHAVDVIHRDLKPENLFVTKRDDGSPRVKVLDFGIAKVVAQSTQSAHTTRNVGTPLYMSPEQMEGDKFIGPAADLYSLGHLAFALLTGKAYWDPESRKSSSLGLGMKILKGLPEPATARALADGVTLPEAFDAWFATATALEPRARFKSAPDLVDALERALDATAQNAPAPASPAAQSQAPQPAPAVAPEPPPGLPASSRVEAPSPRRRQSVPLIAGVLAATLLLAWFKRKDGDDPSPTPPIPSASASIGPPAPSIPVPTPPPASVSTPPSTSPTPRPPASTGRPPAASWRPMTSAPNVPSSAPSAPTPPSEPAPAPATPASGDPRRVR